MSAKNNPGPLTLNAEQESELREAFDLFDRDGDQMIAAKELHVVMQAIGRNMELEEVEKNIKAIKLLQRSEYGEEEDEDDVGDELNLDEFITFISKEMLENDVKEELVEAYRKFSGNDDLHQGITRQQLQDTMMAYGEKRLSAEEFNQLFEETDADGDGFINFDDFVRMMMSRWALRPILFLQYYFLNKIQKETDII